MAWIRTDIRSNQIFYFTGSPGFRGGAAEYLKASPDHVDKTLRAIGAISPPGRYIFISRGELESVQDAHIHAILCLGPAQNIRNLISLVHFRSIDPFDSVIAPWGPSCATFITYPAAMAENAPRDSVFVGPVDPTCNYCFPSAYMALGIPIHIARVMVDDMERSFIHKRSHIAFP